MVVVSNEIATSVDEKIDQQPLSLSSQEPKAPTLSLEWRMCPKPVSLTRSLFFPSHLPLFRNLYSGTVKMGFE